MLCHVIHPCNKSPPGWWGGCAWGGRGVWKLSTCHSNLPWTISALKIKSNNKQADLPDYYSYFLWCHSFSFGCRVALLGATPSLPNVASDTKTVMGPSRQCWALDCKTAWGFMLQITFAFLLCSWKLEENTECITIDVLQYLMERVILSRQPPSSCLPADRAGFWVVCPAPWRKW